MKRKYPVIIVITSILIMIIGYFAYTHFIGPVYKNNLLKTIDTTLTGTKTIALAKEKDQRDIFSIEIEISGKTNGITDIIVSNEKSPVHTIALKGGEIDYIYKADWYSDSCFLRIEGRDQSTGNLHIEYRFLGLN